MTSMLDLVRYWFAAKALSLALTFLPESDMAVVARRYISNACTDLIDALEEN